VIIIVGPFLGKLVEKYKSLNVMMVGMFIYCAGVLITFMSNSEVLFVTGIAVFSIGEFVTHPGFISYVSKIAPKDKVEIYMGAIFLSTGIGITTGPAIMGIWYDNFVVQWNQPKLFGAAIAAVGFLTIALLIIYNRWVNRINKEENPTFDEDTSLWTKTTTSMVVLMLVPAIIGVGIVGGTDIYYGLGEDGDDGGPRLADWNNDYEAILVPGDPISGSLNENTPTTIQEGIEEENVNIITFQLTWVDEPNLDFRYTNQPDDFTLEVESPDGKTHGPESGSNPQGGTGSISIPINYDPDFDPYLNGTGTYNITITCGNCGDQELNRPSLGLQDQPDNGNGWELVINYEYYQKIED
jgi:hypothetical protein